MPRLITLADGRSVEVECVSCALTSGLISSTGGVILNQATFMSIKILLTQLKD